MAAKTAAKDEGRGIDETLAQLKLDAPEGTNPEDVAREAAEQAATVVTSVPDPEAPPPASTVEVTAVPSAEPDDPEPEPETEAPPMVPPPRPVRPKRPTTPSSAGKMGKGIADKVPGAEKVKVYKRVDGQRWHVRDYMKSDLTGYSDFESFLNRWVKPEHKAGEYDLVGVTSTGAEMELGTVRLLESPGESSGGEGGALKLVHQMLADKEKSDAEWRKKLEDSMSATPDPIAMLNGVIDMRDKLTPDVAPAPANTGGSDTMQMFMASMQQQTQMMMALLTKPKEESAIEKLLIMKLTEEGGLGGGGGGAPLPVPPPPPVQESPASMLTAMAGFMQVMQPQGGGGDAPAGPDPHTNFLEQMLLSKQAEGLGTKEVIQLLLAKDNKPGSDDFRSAVDNMAAIMNIANNVNRQAEGGGSAGFFDAIAALVSNRDFAGSIANAVRTKAQTGAGGPALAPGGAPPGAIPATPPQRQPANAAEAAAMIDQRQAQLAEAQRRLYQEKQRILGNASLTTAPMAQAPPPGQPVAMTSPVSPPEPSPPPATAVEPGPDRSSIPQLPPTTPDYINRLAQAPDEAALVSEAVALFLHLGEHPQWHEFMETVLSHIRTGNKAGTLDYLSAFFGGLAQIQLIDPRVAKATVQALTENFDTMVEELQDIPLDGDDDITGDDLLASPENTQGLGAPGGSPVALVEDDGEEDGEDEESS